MTGDASRWTWGEETRLEGLAATPFRVEVHGRTVPGMLWGDEASLRGRARPLVMLQHGGSGHKADAGIVQQLRPLILDCGFLAATIDGPIHGERVQPPAPSGAVMRDRFLSLWRTDHRIDTMVQDWHAVLAGLAELPPVDAARIGWLGTSMGTAYGLSVVADCPSIKAAVLGKWAGDYVNSERLMLDAPRIRCPVLFIQRWDDELFSREGTLGLFDRIGSADKRLHVYPGSHFLPGGEPLEDAVAHLRRYLGQGR